MKTEFHYAWKEPDAHKRFATGISLHGHTWHSREGLGFLPGVAKHSNVLPILMRWLERKFEGRWHEPIDYDKGYWTSPVSPEKAYQLEAGQIEALGLAPFVSITDHDETLAASELRAAGHANVPVSLEWTAPYGDAVFHIGVHNIPPAESDALQEELRAFTVNPDPAVLAALLEKIDSMPNALIVFNHPLSDQGRIGHEVHTEQVDDFLKHYGRFVHALEVNAMQPAGMNRRVNAIAEAAGFPIVAGGDRHSFEPNGIINLTNADSFESFVREIRTEKKSTVLFMPQYERPLALRYSENVTAIMDDYPEEKDRAAWHDRVFYRCPDGVTRTLTEMARKRIRPLAASKVFLEAARIVNRLLRPIEPVFIEPDRHVIS